MHSSRSLVPRMIGGGAYGCVYYPPPNGCSTCKDVSSHGPQPKVCTHGVVKLMDHRSALDEIRLLKQVKAIDPRGHYHWKLLRVCPAPRSTSSWPTDERGRRCSHFLGPDPLLLYFPYGGRPFEDLVYGQDVFTLVTLLAMRRIFQGLRAFQRAGFVHADIKPANMVYVRSSHSPSMSLPYYIKFIDFSLSFSVSKNRLSAYAVYAYWPPEAILLTSHRTLDRHTLKTYGQDAFQAALSVSTKASPHTINQKVKRTTSPILDKWLDKMERWYRDEASFRKVSRHKFDVYGFGVTLMSLYSFGSFSSDLRSNSIFMEGLKGMAQRAMAFDAEDRPSASTLYSMYKDLLSTAFSPDSLVEGTRRLGPVSIPRSIRPL